MKPAERKNFLSDFTPRRRMILGAALFIAGISDSLRHVWRIDGGEPVYTPLIFTLTAAVAGIWIFRRAKKNQRHESHAAHNVRQQ